MTTPAAGFQVDDLNPELAVLHELLAPPDLDAAAREMIDLRAKATQGLIVSDWQGTNHFELTNRATGAPCYWMMTTDSGFDHGPDLDFTAFAFNHAVAVAREMLRRGDQGKRIAALEQALRRVLAVVESPPYESCPSREVYEERVAAFTEARTALEGAPCEATWRGIESAPKDGREVLLGSAPAKWRAVGYWCQGGWVSPETGEIITSATHWMELPASPLEAATCPT